MSELGGEFRPTSGWGAMRTVCHGCRTMREVVEQVGSHQFEARSMVVPGDGRVYRRVASTFAGGEVIVEEPCPMCEDTETPGWLAGLQPSA